MILLIEDNLEIAEGLKLALEEEGYQFINFDKLADARKYLKDYTPSLIILDVLLLDGNGFSFYEEYKREKDIPTIFLTAYDDEEWVVKGLEMGADDYVTKPFSTKELLIRIKKILMRNKKETIIKVGDVTFDMDNFLAKVGDKKIEFTALEYKILQLLLLNKGNVVLRDTILDMVYLVTGNDVDSHTITVYIKRIKDKLGVDIIKTIKGVGYKIDEE